MVPHIGHRAFIRGGHLGQHRQLAIAVDEMHGEVEVEQLPERLAGHRARHHIASDHDLIDVGVTKFLEDRLQGGEVGVNIIECSDSHDRPSSLSSELMSHRTSCASAAAKARSIRKL